MDVEKTVRGFEFAKFYDATGNACVLRQSSSAEGYYLWLGKDVTTVTRFTPGYERTDDTSGEGLHETIDLLQELKTTPNSDVCVHSLMYLGEAGVRELRDALSNWLDHGSLAAKTPAEVQEVQPVVQAAVPQEVVTLLERSVKAAEESVASDEDVAAWEKEKAAAQAARQKHLDHMDRMEQHAVRLEALEGRKATALEKIADNLSYIRSYGVPK